MCLAQQDVRRGIETKEVAMMPSSADNSTGKAFETQSYSLNIEDRESHQNCINNSIEES